MNRREFFAAVVGVVGSFASPLVSELLSDDDRNWYLVEIPRAGKQVGMYHFVVVESDIPIVQRHDALFSAWAKDQEKYPDANRPEIIDGTIRIEF